MGKFVSTEEVENKIPSKENEDEVIQEDTIECSNCGSEVDLSYSEVHYPNAIPHSIHRNERGEVVGISCYLLLAERLGHDKEEMKQRIRDKGLEDDGW
jgi:hypothetical protein